MRLHAIGVFVDDLGAARSFYHQGLGLAVKWEDEAAIGFDIGGHLIVERVARDADADDRALVGRIVGCSIAIDDIARLGAAFSRMSRTRAETF